MTLTEMRQWLDGRGIQLTRSLGQNFLHDGNQLRRIVAAAELSTADRVLEIGPGMGPLTELLLANSAEVVAIEKDLRLVEFLRERFNAGHASDRPPISGKSETIATPVLQLLHDDALDFLKREPRDWCDWKLVANLPYSVASPILVELAQNDNGPQRMVATLQLEVARRIVAQAGDPDYGVLSLLIQLRYEPHSLFKIPAPCFFPEPEVDSACVTLVRRSQPLLTAEQSQTFTKIVKHGFSQRRKMMFKLLRQDWPVSKLVKSFESLGLPAQARAETVNLTQFVQLTEALSS